MRPELHVDAVFPRPHARWERDIDRALNGLVRSHDPDRNDNAVPIAEAVAIQLDQSAMQWLVALVLDGGRYRVQPRLLPAC